jgi:di/tricarboxylate transporter
MDISNGAHYVVLLPSLVLPAVLISMSLGLQSLGVIDTFSGWAGGQLDALALPWPALFAGLHLTYFGAHYLFASQTAHVGALYAAFCSLMISAGKPRGVSHSVKDIQHAGALAEGLRTQCFCMVHLEVG